MNNQSSTDYVTEQNKIHRGLAPRKVRLLKVSNRKTLKNVRVRYIWYLVQFVILEDTIYYNQTYKHTCISTILHYDLL